MKKNNTKWYNNSDRRKYLKSEGLLKKKRDLKNNSLLEYRNLIKSNIENGLKKHEEYLNLISENEYERLSKKEELIIKNLEIEGLLKNEIDTYIEKWQESVTSNRKDYIRKLDENRKNIKSRSYQNRMRKNG